MFRIGRDAIESGVVIVYIVCFGQASAASSSVGGGAIGLVSLDGGVILSALE